MNIYCLIWTVLTVGLAFWSYRQPVMITVTVCLTLAVFQAAAAIMVGGFVIQPGFLAIGLLGARLAAEITSPTSARLLGQAISCNAFALAFAGYAVFSAMAFPSLFEGILVYPVETAPGRNGRIALDFLGPGAGNLTQSVYILATTFFCVATSYAVIRDRSLDRVSTAVIITTVTALTVATAQIVILGGGGQFHPAFFYNNTGYRIADIQRLAGFPRINGSFTEPSSLGSLLPAMAAFLLTSYVLDRRRVACGVLALWAIVVAILTTATTAYVGLCGMALAVATVTGAFMRGRYLTSVIIFAALSLLAAVVVIGGLILQFPELQHQAISVLNEALLGKATSYSGLERGRWSDRALQVLVETKMLGAGFGSLKASGLVPLLLGTTGIIGLGLLGAYWLRTMLAPDSGPAAIQIAAAKAGFLTSTLVLVASATDATLLPFWFFGGVASAAYAVRLQENPSAAKAPGRLATPHSIS